AGQARSEAGTGPPARAANILRKSPAERGVRPWPSPSFLSVAERLDFLRQAVFLVDGDPLEHLDALLELGYLVAKAQVLGMDAGVELRIAAIAAETAEAAVAVFRPGDSSDHDDHDDQDGCQLPAIHSIHPLK